MADFRGTPQAVQYVWQGRKPLWLPGGQRIQRGETLTPTVEMLTAMKDLMVPVSAVVQVSAAADVPAVTLERDTRSRSRRDDATG